MKRPLRWIAIALLGLLLSLSFHLFSPVQAQLTGSPESALALMQAGKQHYDAGQFFGAAQALQQAAQLYEAMEDDRGQAQALSLSSLAYQKLGEWEEAETAIATSLALLSAAPPQLQAQIFNTQAHLQLATGETATALETWETAERLYRQANDASGVLGSQINQVQALRSLGLYRRAEQQLNTLEQDVLQVPDSSLQLAGLQSLGTMRRQSGDLSRSEDVLHEALDLAQRLGLLEVESQVYLNLGNTERTLASRTRELGDIATAQSLNQSALGYYERAAAIAQSPTTRLQAQGNQLSLLVDMEAWHQAQTLWQEVAQTVTDLPASRATVYAQVNLAVSGIKVEDQGAIAFDIAERLNHALRQADSLHDQRARSYVLGTLGQWQESQQQWSEAQTTTQQALQLAQAMNAPDLVYQWQWQLGRILCRGVDSCAATGNLEAAIASYTQATEVLNDLRSDLVVLNPDIQFSFRDSVEPIYRELVNLLLQSPSGAEVSQTHLKQARRVIEDLQLAELDNFFRDACAQPISIDIDTLDPTAAIVYPIILRDRLDVILKLPGVDALQHVSQVGLTDKQVNDAIAQFQLMLQRRSTSPRQFRQTSKQLYDWMLGSFSRELEREVERDLSTVKTLVFVLDGAIRNIPPAALYDGERYLVERYAIAIAPGLQLVDPRPFSREQLSALVAGTTNAPSFQQEGLGPIDYVETELTGIQQTIPRSEILEDQQFLKENIQTQIQTAPFNVVHIATHGQFSSNPEQTFILDWKQRIGIRDLETLLQVRDRSAENSRDIELLILSACETAAGDNRAALGLAGIAIRAGARSTLATLFQVNDASTTEFMIRFYQQLTHPEFTKAEALRNTQLAFLNEYEGTDYLRPFHWAPFILVGNWL